MDNARHNTEEISDLEVYLLRMSKSILDKMFFIDKVFEPFDTIVDFGCANGELIKALRLLFDEYEYVGYDNNPRMIAEARRAVPEARFTTDWNELGVSFPNSLLNISSTIHEVYSYCERYEIEQFWQRVFESGFRYVTIRDMMFSDTGCVRADPEDLRLVYGNAEFADHLKDYENIWGSIRTRNELVHYLLKYSYSQNWEREVRENYVPLSLEAFRKLIPESYEITYFSHYTLPYTAWKVKQDFGIDIKSPTHVKVILKKA